MSSTKTIMGQLSGPGEVDLSAFVQLELSKSKPEPPNGQSPARTLHNDKGASHCFPLTSESFQQTCTATPTVAEVVRGRLDQLIHIEASAVTDPDVVLPHAALVAPVIAHLLCHRALSNRRVFAVEPARCMCTAPPGWHARFRHEFPSG